MADTPQHRIEYRMQQTTHPLSPDQIVTHAVPEDEKSGCRKLRMCGSVR